MAGEPGAAAAVVDMTAAAAPTIAPASSKLKEEEAKKMMQVPFSDLFYFATGFDWFLMLLGTLCGIATGVAMPIFMLIFGEILDEIGRGKGSLQDAINKLAMAMAILATCTFAVASLQVFFFSYASARQTERMRATLLRSILRQEIGWFDTNNGGELATVLSEAAVAFQEGTGRRIADGAQAFAQFAAGLVIAFTQSWRLSLVLIAGLPLIGGAAAMLGATMSEAKSASGEQYAKAGGVANESLGAIRTVASLCAERRFIDAYSIFLEEAKRVGIQKSAKLGLANGMLFSAAFFIYALAFWYGSQQVAAGLDCVNAGGSNCITGGAVITTFFSFLIGAFSLGQLAPTLNAVAVARASLVRVMEIVKRTPTMDSLSDGGAKLESVRGDIEFDVQDFAYPARPEKKVCHNYRLSVKAGETVALCGASGSGKSTAISLLLRFYDPCQGTITLDGTDIRSLNIKWLRDQIGYVGQEPVLFVGSIWDNIRAGKPTASEAEIIEAAKAANAHDFIMSFPDGYGTQVGQKGSQMSGGQKQRIAIARAVIKNPAILLLDEATSALDQASEVVVQAALDGLQKAKRRTTFVVAHRLSTIRNADRIAVIDHGHVKELGTHEELLSLNGKYAELVALQGGLPSPGPSHATAAGEAEEAAKKKAEAEKESKIKAAQSNIGVSLSRRLSRALSIRRAPQTDGEERPSLWGLSFRHWPYLTVGILANCALGVLFPFWGYLLANVMDTFYSPDKSYILSRGSFWSGMFVILGVSAITFYTLAFWGLGHVSERLSCWLRKSCFEAMMRRNIGWFEAPENSLGSLCSRLETETQQIHKISGDMLGRQCQAFFTLFVGLLFSFSASWEIALVTLATFPVQAGANAIQMQVALGQSTDKAGMDGAEASGLLSAAIGSIRTVAAFTMQESIQGSYQKAISPLSSSRKVRGLVTGVIFGFTQFVLFASYGLLFWFGGKLVSDGKYTFQEMMVSIMSILMGAMGLGQALTDMADVEEGRRATNRVLDLVYGHKNLTIDSLSADGERLKHVDGAIEFRGIHFRYPSRPEQWILGGPSNPDGFSLRIEPGKTVAFVGQSGSGKSTLVNFTLRFYDPEQGAVLLDGKDLRSLNVHDLRNHVAYVGQEPVLFKGSVAANISFGKPEATRDEIIAAAKAAHAHGFISEWTDGYDTDIAAGSLNLSGGQKQRLAIARAIIKDAPILLLDEATSALDNESERQVQAALDELQESKKRTTIVIAHRLSTIRNVDLIVCMAFGKIVELGSFDQLMKLDGTFATLARQQGLA